jgi:hypothetical protein
MAERSIDDRERYVGYATHCLQLAKVATDRESRAVLKEMAAVGRSWPKHPLTEQRAPPADGPPELQESRPIRSFGR